MVYYYIYYWNLQFLNNVIINKTNVILPQAYMTLNVFWLSLLGHLVLMLQEVSIIRLSNLSILSVSD